MSVENLRLGPKDFGKRRKTYKLLARIYVEGEKMEKPFTQRELLKIAESIEGFSLTENTFRRYIKKERGKNLKS